LQRVHETTGNTQTDWQQEYVYDRYGNRTIHQTNTYGIGVNKKDCEYRFLPALSQNLRRR
jgi:hypothetical protein